MRSMGTEDVMNRSPRATPDQIPQEGVHYPVMSIMLAIELGYTAVFLLGAACYAAAALPFVRWAFPAERAG